MNEQTARAILRIVAIVTTLTGLIATTVFLIAMLGAGQVERRVAEFAAAHDTQVQVQGIMASVGFYAIMGYAAIIAWGVALFFTSPALARHVVK